MRDGSDTYVTSTRVQDTDELQLSRLLLCASVVEHSRHSRFRIELVNEVKIPRSELECAILRRSVLDAP